MAKWDGTVQGFGEGLEDAGKKAKKAYDDFIASTQSGFNATTYKTDPNAYNIQNQYGGQLAGAIAGAQGRQTATIDQSQANQFRGGQGQLAGLLMQGAMGRGPSAAQAQLRSGLERNNAAARSMAAGSSNPLLARKIASDAMTSANLETNNQMAALRASEQQQAQGALAGVLSNARQQDLGVAGQQASLEMQNRQQMDQAMQAYIAMGMSREEAQQKALADMQALKAQQHSDAQKLNQATADANKDRQLEAAGGIFGGISSALSSLSDRRLKTNIKEGDSSTRGLLDALSAQSFDYKDERHGGKDVIGVMAQDLEKSPGGRLMVINTPEGKAIDGQRGLSAALASAAHLNKRVASLEEALRRSA